MSYRTSLIVSGIDGKGDNFSGVVLTSCTAFGPLILRFSNSSSEAAIKQNVVGFQLPTHEHNNIMNVCQLSYPDLCQLHEVQAKQYGRNYWQFQWNTRDCDMQLGRGHAGYSWFPWSQDCLTLLLKLCCLLHWSQLTSPPSHKRKNSELNIGLLQNITKLWLTQVSLTFSMVCRSVAGSSMMCLNSSVTSGVKPLKPELCVRPNIIRVLFSSANIMAYWWLRVRRKQSRNVAWRVSGSTGTLIILTQARIRMVVMSSLSPCTTISGLWVCSGSWEDEGADVVSFVWLVSLFGVLVFSGTRKSMAVWVSSGLFLSPSSLSESVTLFALAGLARRGSLMTVNITGLLFPVSSFTCAI